MHIQQRSGFENIYKPMERLFSYPPAEAEFYRGIERNKVNAALTPWGVKYTAFRSRAGETDGPAILPLPHLCYSLDIDRVARVHVGRINEIRNPDNCQPLTVVQLDPDRAFIANMPGFLARAKAVEDCATELAESTELLPVLECEKAKARWDSLVPATPPVPRMRRFRPA